MTEERSVDMTGRIRAGRPAAEAAAAVDAASDEEE